MGGGQRHLLYQKTVGSLCGKDYKGVGNEYVDEKKCIVCNISETGASEE